MKHNNSLFLSPRAAKKKKHPLTIAGKKTEKMQWIPPRLFFSFIASSRLPKALKKSKEWKSVTNESTFYDAQIELFFMLIWEKYDFSFRVYFYNFAGTKERNSRNYLPLKSSFFIEDQVFIERREENKANIYEFLRHSNNFTIFFINHVKRKSSKWPVTIWC